MNTKSLIASVLAASAILASGCATYGGYQPVVDAQNDPNAYRINQDMEECRALAGQAGNTGTETMKGAGAGALIGAAGGAAMGAIVGNPATGAAIGATVGGIGGAANQGMDADNQFKRAYINCLRGRGHNVIN